MSACGIVIHNGLCLKGDRGVFLQIQPRKTILGCVPSAPDESSRAVRSIIAVLRDWRFSFRLETIFNPHKIMPKTLPPQSPESTPTCQSLSAQDLYTRVIAPRRRCRPRGSGAEASTILDRDASCLARATGSRRRISGRSMLRLAMRVLRRWNLSVRDM